MEASERSVAVALRASGQLSRPGPAFGCREGVFQASSTGEYHISFNLPASDALPDSRTRDRLSCPHSANAPASSMSLVTFSSPGRTVDGIMEVPERSVAVALRASGQLSRPGPAYGCREGIFQTLLLGEYQQPQSDDLPHPHIVSLSSSSGSESPNLSIYYQNVRGLRTKVTDFYLAVIDRDYDVVVLTETWLNDDFTTQQLFGDSYNVYWKHRDAISTGLSFGGGVLIAVSRRLTSYPHPLTPDTPLEQLWVLIEGVQRKVCVGVFYIRPLMASDAQFIDDHLNAAALISRSLSPNDHHIIFGDYNQPNLHWIRSPSGYAFPDPGRSTFPSSSAALVDGMVLFGFNQLNTVVNHLNRTLDLVYINSEATHHCAVETAPEALIGVDPNHPPLVATLACTVPYCFEEPPDERPYCFRKANFVALNEVLSVTDWIAVDQAVSAFNNIRHSLFREYVPPPAPRQKPLWSNSKLRDLKTQRAAALRRYSSLRNPATKRAFCRASNRYRRYKRRRYANHIKRTQAYLKKNPKSFWSFVNEKRKESGLPSSLFLGNTTCTTTDQMCNLFATHFSSVFSHDVPTENQIHAALESVPANILNFSTIEFSVDDVKVAAAKLKPSSSAGPDGIPSIVLKNCAESLARPLCAIFNKSIATAVFPAAWKKSFLVPVFKKGDKRDISNYRGITSLCAGSKLMEIILCKYLSFILKSYISIDQHGFCTGRSTNTNLVEFTSFCLRNMEGGGQVDAVYTDLKAAFDRINHKILLAKLDHLGMPNSLVQWFESYLSCRTLIVRLGNAESAGISCSSGVPQGSNIGPMCFSTYYNDVTFVLPTGCRLLYADDLKIFHIIKDETDCHYLQDLINTFASWCASNLLSLSIHKCSMISFTRKRQPVTWTYAVGCEALERVDVVKDLGVLLDTGLSFNNHYCNMITKANRNLGFLFRTAYEFRDLSCLRILFYALVRSHLEFGAIVWCPYDRIWIDRIESIQRKFTRFALRFQPLPDNVPLSYMQRNLALGLAKLDQRRTFLRASFIGKLLLGAVDAPNILARVNINVIPRPLRTREFLRLDLQRTLYGQNEPIRAMCDVFNCVYDVFDFELSVNSLLCKLRIHLLAN